MENNSSGKMCLLWLASLHCLFGIILLDHVIIQQMSQFPALYPCSRKCYQTHHARFNKGYQGCRHGRHWCAFRNYRRTSAACRLMQSTRYRQTSISIPQHPFDSIIIKIIKIPFSHANRF